jgi:hypothetical protein
MDFLVEHIFLGVALSCENEIIVTFRTKTLPRYLGRHVPATLIGRMHVPSEAPPAKHRELHVQLQPNRDKRKQLAVFLVHSSETSSSKPSVAENIHPNLRT